MQLKRERNKNMDTYIIICEMFGRKWFFDKLQKIFRNVDNPNVTLDVPEWALFHLKFCEVI
jgi:hypothetical protein